MRVPGKGRLSGKLIREPSRLGRRATFSGPLPRTDRRSDRTRTDRRHGRMRCDARGARDFAMTCRTRALVIGLGCVLTGTRRPARAQEPPPTGEALAITATGECPSEIAIRTDIKAIVPASDLEKVTGAKIDVSDLGSTYHVRISGQEGQRQRTFRDVDRDCDHRARFTAVFIVVTLLPPDVLLESPSEPPPAPSVHPAPAPLPTVVAAAPVSNSPRSRRLRIELAALLDAAPAIGGG